MKGLMLGGLLSASVQNLLRVAGFCCLFRPFHRALMTSRSCKAPTRRTTQTRTTARVCSAHANSCAVAQLSAGCCCGSPTASSISDRTEKILAMPQQ